MGLDKRPERKFVKQTGRFTVKIKYFSHPSLKTCGWWKIHDKQWSSIKYTDISDRMFIQIRILTSLSWNEMSHYGSHQQIQTGRVFTQIDLNGIYTKKSTSEQFHQSHFIVGWVQVCTRKFWWVTCVQKTQDQLDAETVQRVCDIRRIIFACGRGLFLFPPLCDMASWTANWKPKWAGTDWASFNHWAWARLTSLGPAHWPVCGLPTYSCMFHKNALWCGK